MKFSQKSFENWWSWKTQFFLSWPFWTFFYKKNFFASSPCKSVKGSWISRMGQNFDDYPGFQPKITHPKHFSRQCKYHKAWNFSSQITKAQATSVSACPVENLFFLWYHQREEKRDTKTHLSVLCVCNMCTFSAASIKVSKSRKQNTKISHTPKNQQNFVHFFPPSL